MVMWVEVLKNKPPSKQNPKINKYLLSFFHEVFDAFDCKEDIKTSFYNWNNAKNMF